MAFLLMGRVFDSSHQFHQWIRYRTIDLVMAHIPRNRGKLWIADNCALIIIRIEDLMVNIKAKIAFCKQELQSGNCAPPHGIKRGFHIQVLLLKYKLELSGYRHLNYALFDQQMRMQLSTAQYEALPYLVLSDYEESDDEEDDYEGVQDGVVQAGSNQNVEDNDDKSHDEEMDDNETDEGEDEDEDKDEALDGDPMDEKESDQEV
ncbi:hypothetical protein DFP73DRAFT_529801 [Morchella snyderi]|nr:hypothetical protein DFP73DRAFT_529801 [Morchella snyderi]